MASRNREGLGGEYHRVVVQPENYEILDGDTIGFRNGFEIAGRNRVHLHGIDAPELEQTLTVTEDFSGNPYPHIDVAYQRIGLPAVGDEMPIGTMAKQALEHLCDSQPIEIYNMFWDRFYSAEHGTGNIYADVRAWSRRYGRSSGTLLNLSMVGAGLAMVHTYYSDQHLSSQAFSRKRHARLSNRRTGFWAFLRDDEEDFLPRTWRRNQRLRDRLDEHHDEETSETGDRLDPNESWVEEDGERVGRVISRSHDEDEQEADTTDTTDTEETTDTTDTSDTEETTDTTDTSDTEETTDTTDTSDTSDTEEGAFN